jgi:hypothetical protein
MTKQNLFRFLLALALIVVLGGIAFAVWRLGKQPGAAPIPPASPMQVSPLLTPTIVSAKVSPSDLWSSRGAALLWVVLGGLLALVTALFVLRRHRQDV